ncbi:MAG: hypothetical protein HFE68_01700 [Erysipelotrichaceae bacterium]|nr:hypothetical protein [Erysipelotrichaceae bacterium]
MRNIGQAKRKIYDRSSDGSDYVTLYRFNICSDFMIVKMSVVKDTIL